MGCGSSKPSSSSKSSSRSKPGSTPAPAPKKRMTREDVDRMYPVREWQRKAAAESGQDVEREKRKAAGQKRRDEITEYYRSRQGDPYNRLGEWKPYPEKIR
ncbi:hypothetical protein HG530_014837 [Fusarium avenaceum]|nr:hypothetical protein HG530_014837 [Fusarium avenaceum]